MTHERSDTGTSARLSRGEIYRRARKVRQLADIAMDCTGPMGTDLSRAQALLNEIAAICGMGEEE
ncbi:hypothetical protein [Sphingobium indicum]